MTRRTWLQVLLAAGIWGVSRRGVFGAQALSMKEIESLQKNWKALLAEGTKIPLPSEPLKRSKEEWRKRLSANQFYILWEGGTERLRFAPVTSEMKYESGTGWPSFFTTIPGVFGTNTDFKLVLPRTEYHCIRCGGHHGHVFDDGPPPTGKRWCNNGVALKFIPKSGKA